MRTINRVGFVAFHLIMMGYAAVLFFGAAVNIVRAQTLRDYRLENVEKQVADINALRLDQRLIRIETLLAGLESHDWVTNLSTGGIGLLLARAAYEEVRKRRTSE
jgi:hypothetical protein